MPSTEIIKIDPDNPQPERIFHCAQTIRNGGLVVFPTETVYGIAANLLDKKAIERLFEIKKRPRNKQFTIHIANKQTIEIYAFGISVLTYKLIDKFWPGPMTVIVRSKDNSTVGLRMPKNNIALNLISQAGVPIVAPSANITGRAAPKKFDDAIKDLDGLVDIAIDGGDAQLGVESSVVDLSGISFQILREGAIAAADIEKLAKTKTVFFVCTGNSCRSVMAEYLLKKMLKENSRDDVEVSSAGVSACDGMRPTVETIKLLEKEGIDASGHRAQRLGIDLVKKSDLILVMDRVHEELILSMAPDSKNRVYLLKEFAKIDSDLGSLNVADPIGRTEQYYQDIFYTIKESVQRIIKLI